MSGTSKLVAVLLFAVLAVGILTTTQATAAESITKPSVPEFTAKYVDRSYNTQPTYGIDQYTGKTVVTKASQHVDNRTIEITIKNQPFTKLTDGSSGREINLFIMSSIKGRLGRNGPQCLES
jgi:hypothetical protein